MGLRISVDVLRPSLVEVAIGSTSTFLRNLRNLPLNALQLTSGALGPLFTEKQTQAADAIKVRM